MTNITVNSKKNTIEMTKKFAKAASRYGSEEYKQLQDARRDYPTYAVVTKTTNKKAETNKGLTYSYMEKYIETHDDENKSIMAEYEMLRGISDEAKEMLAESVSYTEMKAWFFKKYPAIAEFHKLREKTLAA